MKTKRPCRSSMRSVAFACGWSSAVSLGIIAELSNLMWGNQSLHLQLTSPQTCNALYDAEQVSPRLLIYMSIRVE